MAYYWNRSTSAVEQRAHAFAAEKLNEWDRRPFWLDISLELGAAALNGKVNPPVGQIRFGDRAVADYLTDPAEDSTPSHGTVSSTAPSFNRHNAINFT
jgi:hypothetical protein